MIATPENPFRAGLRTERVGEPCAMVIFGASGDLSHRKLLPALYNLGLTGVLPANFAVVGFAKDDFSRDSYRSEMKKAVGEFSRRKPLDEEIWSDFAAGLDYVSGNFDDPAAFQRLKAALERADKERGTRGNRLYYCAVPPSVMPMILKQLHDAGLLQNGGRGNPWSRIILEKPFGHDTDSARELNGNVHDVFAESQVYRIDHYLGKETVQNLMVFRFGNSIFEPIWNRQYVDHVQITAAEDIGVERRGGYYEEAGILRDMVQNHLMQLLSLTAMEAPVAFDADAVRDEKVKVLRSIRPVLREEVQQYTVRGQYARGAYHGKPVPAYREEERVAKDSRTATFTALKLFIDNWRWDGVPFYLRTGKRLPKRVTEISVHFARLPHSLFGALQTDTARNVLAIRIQPDEGISMRFNSKVPGEGMRVRTVNMDFRYGQAFGAEPPEAYERLLLDAMIGDATLFTRADEVDTAWKLVTEILEGWKEWNAEPSSYEAGSWGPQAAEELIAADGRHWRRL
ncbi:MAG: glucose-6-phosphate dehydrogenase [Deltaproteobacteria bacterium]|nr:glucose-6-phosphate dehydrogenase [Deltaproteobacteria bacterium]